MDTRACLYPNMHMNPHLNKSTTAGGHTGVDLEEGCAQLLRAEVEAHCLARLREPGLRHEIALDPR